MYLVSIVIFNEFPLFTSDDNGKLTIEEPLDKSDRFYYFYSHIPLNKDDYVIAQVGSTFAVGKVNCILSDTVTQEDFYAATLCRSEKVKNGYRLIVAKFDLDSLQKQYEFKCMYSRHHHLFCTELLKKSEVFQKVMNRMW